MIDKYFILIDERDQSINLKSIKVKLREVGLNLEYKQLVLNDIKFQTLDEKDDVPHIDIEKIKSEIIGIQYFKRASVIAVDFNLIENALNGFDVARVIRSLGYNVNKPIIIYSAGIERAIEKIITIGDTSEKIDNLKTLVKGNFIFAKRDDYEDEIIRQIKQEPEFNFENEITSWLHKFGERKLKDIYPPFSGIKSSEIAEEIEKNTSLSQSFRKQLVELLFSYLIELNEIE